MGERLRIDVPEGKNRKETGIESRTKTDRYWKRRQGKDSTMEKQTIVVKVGTSSLTKEDGSLSQEQVTGITTQLAELCHMGHRVILVSSGAVAAGFGRLGFHKRPTRIAD